MLVVEDLHAGYGRIPVLSGIGFRVGANEVVGVLGHNGMGKTTLLKSLIGQVPLTSGSIRLDDAEIGGAAPFRRARAGLGYVPQGRAIFANLSVRDNLRMGVLGRGDGDAGVMDEVLARFPRLAAMLERPGSALSGGEQQILALARCLCGRPKLLLLDEPTEGIQPSIVDEIAAILIDLHRVHGLAIIVVEQNLDFISRLSDRVLLIERGRVTGEITPEALTQHQELGGFAAA